MKRESERLVNRIGVKHGDTSDTHEPVDGIVVGRWCGKGTAIQGDVQMHNSAVAGAIGVMVEMAVLVVQCCQRRQAAVRVFCQECQLQHDLTVLRNAVAVGVYPTTTIKLVLRLRH